MIKFFRKIRQKLVSENKFSKYLIYAVGEIVLVVIGILIALNLNNQNEQRKAEAKVDLIFNDIMEELISDIQTTTMPMEHFSRRDSTIYLVLSEQVNYDDYRYNRVPAINVLTKFHNPVNLTQNAYDNLVRELNIVPPKYKPIIQDLEVLYSYHKRFVTDANQDMVNFILDQEHFGMRNYSWWYIRNESEFQESIEFRLNDWRYKNLVSEYQQIGIGNQLRQSIAYRYKAIECYEKIARLLDKPTDHESFAFDQKIAEELQGDWQEVGQPEVAFTIFLKDKRLYGKNSRNNEWEIWSLRRNRIVDSKLNYATIVREKDGVFLKYNTVTYKKNGV